MDARERVSTIIGMLTLENAELLQRMAAYEAEIKRLIADTADKITSDKLLGKIDETEAGLRMAALVSVIS